MARRKRNPKPVMAIPMIPEYVEPYSMFDVQYFINSVWDCAGDLLDSKPHAKLLSGGLMVDLGSHVDACTRPGYHRAMAALLCIWKGEQLPA